MAKKDYPELEGTKITWINNPREGESQGIPEIGIVAGCNFDIGISIQTGDKKHYLMCLNGPSSPIGKKCEAEMCYWPAKFYSAVRMIKSGIIDFQKIVPLQTKITHLKDEFIEPSFLISADSCPFN